MKPAGTQTDKDLAFDGIGQGPARASNKFAGNQHGGRAGGNYGRGPTKGNTGSKKTPSTAAVPSQTKISNPDYINGGAQVRTPGGTRTWDPQCCGNYKGNPDRQNVGRGPTKGNE